MALAAAKAYRDAGEPVAAISAMALAQNVWRRQGYPIDVRVATAEALLEELDALAADIRASREALLVRMDLTFTLAIHLIDARRLDEARALLAETRREAERIGDAEYVMAIDWKAGVADMIEGAAQDGLRRITEAAKAAERAGWESTGVSAFRDASTFAAEALDYEAAKHWIGEGLRYADSIQQSHCAHVMAATSAMVAWAGADWLDASVLASEAIADHGCRRGGRDGALGRRLRGDGSRRPGRRDSGARNCPGLRRGQPGHRAHPAPVVGPGRGGPARR